MILVAGVMLRLMSDEKKKVRRDAHICSSSSQSQTISTPDLTVMLPAAYTCWTAE